MIRSDIPLFSSFTCISLFHILSSKHGDNINKEFDDIEMNRDLFREIPNQTTTELQKYPLIKEINQWEQDSIQKIKQTAEEARQSILKCISKNNNKIEENLIKLTNQLKRAREEDDITEIDLKQWKQHLTELTEQFAKPSDVLIPQTSTTLTTYINVDTEAQLNISNILMNTNGTQNGVTVAGGNEQDRGLNPSYYSFGMYVDDDQTIYVAEFGNHRIVEWKNEATNGQIVAGGNGKGNRTDQLFTPWNVIIDKENGSFIISDYGNNRVVRWPRQEGTSGETIISNITCTGLGMDNKGYLYVSDSNKHEVRRWKIGKTKGTLVAGGNGQGNRLDQLNTPHYIFIDEDQSVYISDCANHRVMKWLKGAKEGILIAGGQGSGNSLTQLSYPMGIAVDQLGTVYIADYYNHRVMCWLKGAKEGSVFVGGNGPGGQANQLNHPNDLSFNGQNNLYVLDLNNKRVQRFNIIS